MQPTDPITPTLFSPETAAVWLGLFIVALLVDLAVGQWLINRVPRLETLLSPIGSKLAFKLNKSSRTPLALTIRGLIVCTLFLLPLFYIGLFLNSLILIDLYGDILTLLLLVPSIGFKAQLSELNMAETQISRPQDKTKDHHKAARTLISGATLATVPRLLTFGFLFSAAGFAAILPYLWLENLLTAADRTRSGKPESPFFSVPGFLVETITIVPVLVGSLLLALAHFFLTGTNLSVFKSFNPTATFGPASRYFPLKVLAEGLGLSMEADAGCEAENRKAFDRNPRWITSEDGRAKLTGADIRKISIILVITVALHLLSGTMLLTALLLN